MLVFLFVMLNSVGSANISYCLWAILPHCVYSMFRWSIRKDKLWPGTPGHSLNLHGRAWPSSNHILRYRSYAHFAPIIHMSPDNRTRLSYFHAFVSNVDCSEIVWSNILHEIKIPLPVSWCIYIFTGFLRLPPCKSWSCTPACWVTTSVLPVRQAELGIPACNAHWKWRLANKPCTAALSFEATIF